MAIQPVTKYKHYRNGETYLVWGIAIPSSTALTHGRLNNRGVKLVALHTEKSIDISVFDDNLIFYTSEDEYLVIYKKENGIKLYARPVDMFFEHVDGNTKRFTRV